METFTTADKKKLIYDNGTARVYDPVELEKEKTAIEERLAEVVTPTDKELLAWAKANYPYVDHSAEVKRLEEINTLLESIK